MTAREWSIKMEDFGGPKAPLRKNALYLVHQKHHYPTRRARENRISSRRRALGSAWLSAVSARSAVIATPIDARRTLTTESSC